MATQHKTILKRYLPTLMGLFLTSAASVTWGNTSEPHQFYNATTNNFALRSSSLGNTSVMNLGGGYLSYDGRSTGDQALDLSQTSVSYQDKVAVINLDNTVSMDQLVNAFNVGGVAALNYKNFAISAAADFLHNIENTTYTQNFTYLSRIYVNAVLDTSKLPYGENSLSTIGKQTYSNGLQAFTNRYGNQFISQLPLGAMLAVNLKLSFNTLKDKEEFTANMKAGYGSLMSVLANIKQAKTATNARGTLSLYAYQVGGDPTRLANIIGSPSKGSGSFAILNCNFDNLADCSIAVSNVIKYAQNDFAKQVRQTTQNGAPVADGSLAIAGAPTLRYYSALGLNSPPDLPETVYQARSNVNKIFDKNKKDRLLINHYLTIMNGQLNRSGLMALQQIKYNLDTNYELLRQYGTLCYEMGKEIECPEYLKTIQARMIPINQNLIDYYNFNSYKNYDMKVTYYPNGVPSDHSFAIYMDDQNRYVGWVPGGATISKENNTLNIKANFMVPNEDHISAAGNLYNIENDIYSGQLNVSGLASSTISLPMTFKWMPNDL